MRCCPKYNGFTGVTALSNVHTHLFLLGMLVFLWTYNIGVPLTAVMLLVRGVTQVLELSLSSGVSAAISGIAGIGHILTGVGIVTLLVSLRKLAKN